MRNPFRSEADAFRFVWLTIGYFALIVARLADQHLARPRRVHRAHGGRALVALQTRRARAAGASRRPRRARPGEHRILVVANETVGGPELLARDPRAVGGRARHACSSSARRSTRRSATGSSDEDGARDAAQARLDASLAAMRAAGLDATGEIGDGDPIQAIEDALRTFRPDELIVSTHPAGRSHWLERGRRREGARAVRRCPSPTSSSISTRTERLTIDVGRSAAARGRAPRGAPRRRSAPARSRTSGRASACRAHAARRLHLPGRARGRRGRRLRLRLHGQRTGQWWTDRVARSLTAAQRAEWLDPPHFEIVELHVRPASQRRGVGSALLAQLLTRQPHDRALSRRRRARARRAASTRRTAGASSRASTSAPGYPPYLVLGKQPD